MYEQAHWRPSSYNINNYCLNIPRTVWHFWTVKTAWTVSYWTSSCNRHFNSVTLKHFRSWTDEMIVVHAWSGTSLHVSCEHKRHTITWANKAETKATFQALLTPHKTIKLKNISNNRKVNFKRSRNNTSSPNSSISQDIQTCHYLLSSVADFLVVLLALVDLQIKTDSLKIKI